MKSWALSHVAVATIHPQISLPTETLCSWSLLPQPFADTRLSASCHSVVLWGVVNIFFLWLLDFFLRQELWGTLADLELTTQTRLTSNLQQSSCFCLSCVGIAGMPRISSLFEFGHPRDLKRPVIGQLSFTSDLLHPTQGPPSSHMFQQVSKCPYWSLRMTSSPLYE